jgi:hypothetical protein
MKEARLDVGPTLSVGDLVRAPISDASLISDLLEYPHHVMANNGLI